MGLVIILLRLAVLGGVVFGVVFGIAYARRTATHRKRLDEIERDLMALKAGLENGVYDRAEFDALSAEIHRKCEEQGIDAPRLPQPNEKTT